MYIEWQDVEEAKKKAKEYNLSKEELDSILNYIRYSDSNINGALKGGYNMDPDEIKSALQDAQILENAINKLPPFNDNVVYRRDEPKHIFGKYYIKLNREKLITWFNQNEGRYIKYPNFLSTRYSKPPKEDKVLIFIHTEENTKARNLHEIFNGENEVLFKPDGIFKIENVNVNEFEVTLIEILENEVLDLASVIEMNYNFYNENLT